MNLTNPEKLILFMLSEIYDKAGLNEVNTQLLRSSIYSENTWALDMEMPGIVGDNPEPLPPLVNEVMKHLSMWDLLENSFNVLDDSDKEKIKNEAAPFGENVEFPGYDGNNETEALSITTHLTNEMNRFQQFKGRDLNSHTPMLDVYRRMYLVFRSMPAGILATENIIKILKARQIP